MPHIILSTPFQNIAKPNQIGIDVCRGIREGVTNASLCSEMHDALRSILRENSRHFCSIGSVDADIREARACGETRGLPPRWREWTA